MLWEGDTLLQVGARALAILSALTEAPGRLVPKRELLERAWPDGRVDEANLKVQISTLRKALRGYEGLIRAEASLGYRFLGETVPNDPDREHTAALLFSCHRFSPSLLVATMWLRI